MSVAAPVVDAVFVPTPVASVAGADGVVVASASPCRPVPVSWVVEAVELSIQYQSGLETPTGHDHVDQLTTVHRVLILAGWKDLQPLFFEVL